MVVNTGRLLGIQKASEAELCRGTKRHVVLSIGTLIAVLREGATGRANR